MYRATKSSEAIPSPRPTPIIKTIIDETNPTVAVALAPNFPIKKYPQSQNRLKHHFQDQWDRQNNQRLGNFFRGIIDLITPQGHFIFSNKDLWIHLFRMNSKII